MKKFSVYSICFRVQLAVDGTPIEWIQCSTCENWRHHRRSFLSPRWYHVLRNFYCLYRFSKCRIQLSISIGLTFCRRDTNLSYIFVCLYQF
ncbi:hypothetical protein Y032_0025g1107 [Ancylostoma ceylanicum]|uniref:CW-type domain-containing protein n=1 Tax=Ancylostoma ceylanicum TaxID=53326 RepID=A0A016UU87_9BILA|nr:hypothetical protein Y032_0025g1107 [Ancylostoma ceylanicum]